MKPLTQIAVDYSAKNFIHGTDKGTQHSYIEKYEKLLLPYRESAKKILEVGVATGCSLLMWEDYFLQAEIYGMDISDYPARLSGHSRIHFYKHTSIDTSVLEIFGQNMFDVIIDDGSHKPTDQMLTAMLLYRKVVPGGLYIIEDVKNSLAYIYYEVLGATKNLPGNKGRNDRLIVIRK